MEELYFGDIVLLKFPFTDGKSFKNRPALVIADLKDNDILVCRITSKFYNTEFDFNIENWQEVGLKLPSIVRVHKLATLNKELLYLKISRIDETQKNQIRNIFKLIIS